MVRRRRLPAHCRVRGGMAGAAMIRRVAVVVAIIWIVYAPLVATAPAIGDAVVCGVEVCGGGE